MYKEKKYDHLKEIITEMGEMVIGFSGGVDSTLLLKVSADLLGDRAIGVIAKSATYPEREMKSALAIAGEIGASIEIVETDEGANPKFQQNPKNRCYFCKDELFTKLCEVAEEKGIRYIADGTNQDDIGDFRPGLLALKKYSVRSPLREAHFTKNEIRSLSRELGLITHDKPAFACLSSRIPYGNAITEEKLIMVDKAEAYLQSLGFMGVRVRHYDKLARLEIPTRDFEKIMQDNVREKVIQKLKQIGYVYITLDLEGFRSGSMNEVLDSGEKIVKVL